MFANLTYDKAKKRGSRERSSPPCQIRSWYCRDAQRRAAILILTLTLTREFFELSGHAEHDPYGSRRRTIKRFSSRRLWPASAPPSPFMTVDSGTHWLPRRLNLRLRVRAGVPPWDWQLAKSCIPSVGHPNGGLALLKSLVVGQTNLLMASERIERARHWGCPALTTARILKGFSSQRYHAVVELADSNMMAFPSGSSNGGTKLPVSTAYQYVWPVHSNTPAKISYRPRKMIGVAQFQRSGVVCIVSPFRPYASPALSHALSTTKALRR